jgi:hypothetical protein
VVDGVHPPGLPRASETMDSCHLFVICPSLCLLLERCGPGKLSKASRVSQNALRRHVMHVPGQVEFGFFSVNVRPSKTFSQGSEAADERSRHCATVAAACLVCTKHPLCSLRLGATGDRWRPCTPEEYFAPRGFGIQASGNQMSVESTFPTDWWWWSRLHGMQGRSCRALGPPHFACDGETESNRVRLAI